MSLYHSLCIFVLLVPYSLVRPLSMHLFPNPVIKKSARCFCSCRNGGSGSRMFSRRSLTHTRQRDHFLVATRARATQKNIGMVGSQRRLDIDVHL
ncbi:hypothetical protein JTE90_010220 [Oedothorax gibbosus]|uniref:Secreted protein n=1 Tax=Oedothorax gibbosus TaxID=931172 RepID=A0AAV6UIT2_9ARAC|nr:hypothetical protein JTE90_010220 [Oedothorax gibbosus]